MFELMIGIDGVQRRMGERVQKQQRDERGRRSRLRAVLAARTGRAAAPRCDDRLPLAQPR